MNLPYRSKSHVDGMHDKDENSSRPTSAKDQIVASQMVNIKSKEWPFKITAAVLLIACYGLFYGSALVDLGWDWLTYISFSYCAVIPLMSLYVAWTKREALAQLPISPSFFGLIVLASALLMALLGKSIGESIAVRISMVLSIAGLLQFTLGTRVLRAVAFPVSYLLLMIPFPYAIVKEVAYHLRTFDAVAAASALQIMGIPVYRDAHFLHLPDITLEVADLCSGISSVFALFALGIYYVYFLPMTIGRKLLAVASTVPFAAMVNLLRIIITSVAAYYFGTAALGYLIHEMTGTITFFIALGLFVSTGELLVRRGSSIGSQGRDSNMETKEELIRTSSTASGLPKQVKRVRLAILASCALMLFASYIAWQLDTVRGVPLRTDLEMIPQVLGTFGVTRDQPFKRYHDPEAEKELDRVYTDNSRAPIELYVGYNSFQNAGRRLASPKLHLIPGWEISSMESADFKDSRSKPNRGVWLILQNASGKQLVLYWYQVGANVFSSDISHRLYQFKRMILETRGDAAVVRLATPIRDSESADTAKHRLAAFAAMLYPNLEKIIPH